jgi:ABC-2 type transport system permease protein
VSSFASVAGALAYLRVTTFVGAVRSRVKRLKQPKYLIGALVGAAYIYFVFVRRGASGVRSGDGPRAGRMPPPEIFEAGLEAFAEIAALGLILVLLVNWLVPRRAALPFSETEIAFLFPAPVNRRMLVHYRILSGQLSLVFTALIFTLVFRRAGGIGGHAAFHAIGWWVLLATLNLHFTGTTFTIERLRNPSITTNRRRAITIGVAALVLAAVIAWAWSVFQPPTGANLRSAAAVRDYISAQLDLGPYPALLAIPRLLIAPYFTRDLGSFLLAMGPALVVFAVHYFWVIHTEVSFEEASIARAEKRAARVKAVQKGDWRAAGQARKSQRPPFTLGSAGRPEIAFLWKNLLSTSAVFRPTGAIVLVAVVLAIGVVVRYVPMLRPAFFVCSLALVGATLVFGPLIARQDLRADLQNADILKTYPLTGQQLLFGQLLTPIAILTGVTWLALLSLFLTFPATALNWLDPTVRGSLMLGFAVLAPPFVAIQLLVPNAATILFPAWVQHVGNRAEHGIEAMGQRIIFVGGLVVITAFALVPAAAVGAVIFVLVNWLAGGIAGGIVAVLALFAILSFEAWLGIRWLGGRFEAFDLSSELRP